MSTAGIEIGITVESLSTRFLISPNDLHRGIGEYKGLTLCARAMLSALLTYKNGDRVWATTREHIDAIAPEFGRDKIGKILKELRDKGYLFTKRVNSGKGKFMWLWKVFMASQPKEFDPFKTDNISDKEVSGASDQEICDVSAGGAIDVFSGPENTSVKEERRERSTPPLTPQSATTATPSVAPARGVDELEKKAISDALKHRPDWKESATKSAVRQAIEKGLPAQVAYKVIVDLAHGGKYGHTTLGPQRIIAHGPWWRPGEVFVPAPARQAAPRKPTVVPLDMPRTDTIRPATKPPASAKKIFREISALRFSQATASR